MVWVHNLIIEKSIVMIRTTEVILRDIPKIRESILGTFRIETREEKCNRCRNIKIGKSILNQVLIEWRDSKTKSLINPLGIDIKSFNKEMISDSREACPAIMDLEIPEIDKKSISSIHQTSNKKISKEIFTWKMTMIVNSISKCLKGKCKDGVNLIQMMNREKWLKDWVILLRKMKTQEMMANPNKDS